MFVAINFKPYDLFNVVCLSHPPAYSELKLIIRVRRRLNTFDRAAALHVSRPHSIHLDEPMQRGAHDAVFIEVKVCLMMCAWIRAD